MDFKPTELQKKVIDHLYGHARVLAIAGSGKTTTMVYRIKNLIENHNVNPKSIRVLMFNKSASEDFTKKAIKYINSNLPYISTFHSFGFQFIENYIKEMKLNKYKYWIKENEYEIDRLLNRIISELERKNIIEKNKVELDKIKTSISLWKGSLIEPDEAGHKLGNDFVEVYKEFEKQRNNENALTYDDFIPLTINILQKNKSLYEKWSNKIEFLIIDEYQDVNLGQQKLIEILAGNRANIMVVGDDDQTIYEWRGARPEYILKEFETTFTAKPHTIYKLDTTFRFGPLLAQYAYHSISHNRTRQIKNVFANFIHETTDIDFISSNSKNIQNTNDEISKIVIKLVKEDNIKPSKIRVIARLYSQFTGLEGAFIKREIPYKIDGNIPFFKRREVKILVDYSILFENLYTEIDEKIYECLINTINTPNRKINKTRFDSFIKKNKNTVLIDLFDNYLNNIEENEEKIKFSEFVDFIIAGEIYLNEQVEKNKYNNSDLFKWIYINSRLKNHYLNYYGEGEEATDKINTIQGFILFCEGKSLKPQKFSEWLNNLDTTRGNIEENLILFSTVHKTKGLEFDFVVIPDCNEGNMPFISDNQILIYNRLKPDLIARLSDSLESERRLFYVAITRAMKKVYIGTTDDDDNKPSRFLEEIEFNKTKKILDPIVKNESLDESWFEFLKRILGKKKLIDNVKIYLNRIGKDNIRKQVDDMSINVAEDEFSYVRAYPSKKDNFNIAEHTNTWDKIKLL